MNQLFQFNGYLYKVSLIFLLFAAVLPLSAQQTDTKSRAISIGGILGYQYPKSSFFKAGVGLDFEYGGLLVSPSFCVSRNFAQKITGLESSLDLGFIRVFRIVLLSGVGYTTYNTSTGLKDQSLNIKAGLFIPGGMYSPNKAVWRTNFKINYFYNVFLDNKDIPSLGRHGFNFSILLGIGWFLKKD